MIDSFTKYDLQILALLMHKDPVGSLPAVDNVNGFVEAEEQQGRSLRCFLDKDKKKRANLGSERKGRAGGAVS